MPISFVNKYGLAMCRSLVSLNKDSNCVSPHKRALTVKGATVLKLYKISDTKKEYQETWDSDDDTHTVHWGELGTKGQSKEIRGRFLKKLEKTVQKEMDEMVAQGFMPTDGEFTLLIKYSSNDIGTKEDVDKRHRLQERMDETLGWTGLGNCDGGSIGSGTMEVCNFVIDFEVAKNVIENDLYGTEFENYMRIYDGELE